jgi:hypothetical protein
MNEPFKSESNFSAPTVSIPGHKVTWAGEGLQDDRFLFGTETGLVLECGINGSLVNMHSLRLSEDEESINGMSFFFDENALHLAASTRTDIILNSFIINPKQRRTWHAGFGSHGIKRTLGNYFVAPSGPSGIVVLMLEADGRSRVQNPPAIDELRYIYDFATLAPDEGREVAVLACRTDGLLFTHVEPGTGLMPKKISKVGQQIIDFVGVISIRSSASPLAMIGLGKNRSLHFFRDPLHLREIDSVEFSFVPGTAYKLLRHGAHVILLTSKGICLVPEIISQFHRGENIGGERRVRFIGLEAIDINVAFGKWLLVVMTDGVARIDLEEVLPRVEIPDAIEQRMATDFGALWKEEADTLGIEQPVWTETNQRAEVLLAVR